MARDRTTSASTPRWCLVHEDHEEVNSGACSRWLWDEDVPADPICRFSMLAAENGRSPEGGA